MRLRRIGEPHAQRTALCCEGSLKGKFSSSAEEDRDDSSCGAQNWRAQLSLLPVLTTACQPEFRCRGTPGKTAGAVFLGQIPLTRSRTAGARRRCPEPHHLLKNGGMHSLGANAKTLFRPHHGQRLRAPAVRERVSGIWPRKTAPAVFPGVPRQRNSGWHAAVKTASGERRDWRFWAPQEGNRVSNSAGAARR